MSQYTGKLSLATDHEHYPKAQKKRPPRIGNYTKSQLYLREDGMYQWFGIDDDKILVSGSTPFRIPEPKTTPKVTRRITRDSNYESTKAQVRLRDKGLCVNCKDPASGVHHIMGRKSLDVFSDIRFLCLLCNDPRCHGDYANTTKTIGKLLSILKMRYHYKYESKYDWYFEEKQ